MPADSGSPRLLNPTAAPRFSPWPTSIGIEITGRCQLRCRHCFNESGPEHDEDLPLTLIERTLDEMHAWGVGQIRITGGEPTLHPQLPAILAACAGRGIAVNLNTHGVLAEATLKVLLTAPAQRFLVSLDGLQTAHDQVRGAGNFRRTVATCRRLREADKAVTLACHYGRHNLADVAGLAALAAELGADLKLTVLRPLGRLLDQFADHLPRPEDGFTVAREVVGLRRLYPGIRIYSDFDILDDRREPFAVTDAWAACGAGRAMVSIAWNGDVYPCAYFATPDKRFCAGNLCRGTLAEIWRDSPVFEPFRTHTKAPACQACRLYRRYCAGGCPAVAYATSGALDALDPNCFAHILEPAA